MCLLRQRTSAGPLFVPHHQTQGCGLLVYRQLASGQTRQAGPLSPWIEMAEEQYKVDRESRPVQPSSLREELRRPGRPNL